LVFCGERYMDDQLGVLGRDDWVDKFAVHERKARRGSRVPEIWNGSYVPCAVCT
jgi:hypothetical protein